jgi:hypothetical protein
MCHFLGIILAFFNSIKTTTGVCQAFSAKLARQAWVLAVCATFQPIVLMKKSCGG